MELCLIHSSGSRSALWSVCGPAPKRVVRSLTRVSRRADITEKYSYVTLFGTPSTFAHFRSLLSTSIVMSCFLQPSSCCLGGLATKQGILTVSRGAWTHRAHHSFTHLLIPQWKTETSWGVGGVRVRKPWTERQTQMISDLLFHSKSWHCCHKRSY